VTDLRLLPDVELLVGDILTDVDWSTKTPADLASEVPCRTVRKISGAWIHPKFIDRPVVVIDSYGPDEDTATALGETARVLLVDAWLAQTRTSHGVIHRLVEMVSPFTVRTGTEPDGVAHVSSTYRITVIP
jgi:hypothetical protein